MHKEEIPNLKFALAGSIINSNGFTLSFYIFSLILNTFWLVHTCDRLEDSTDAYYALLHKSNIYSMLVLIYLRIDFLSSSWLW